YARGKIVQRTIRSARQAGERDCAGCCRVRRAKSPAATRQALRLYICRWSCSGSRVASRIRQIRSRRSRKDTMREITYRQALNKELAEELERGPNCFLMGGELD